MITFDEARQIAEDATGFPTKEYGFEGADRFIVVLIRGEETSYDDRVLTVGKDGARVRYEPYSRDEMDAWPRVEAGRVVAG